MKKALIIEEIVKEAEKRKRIRREKLKKKIVALTKNCDREDVIYIFSSLISKITQ